MKIKISTAFLLCFFISFNVHYLVQAQTKEAEKNKTGKIIVYYFHGEFRCQSCLRIEELLGKTLKSSFKKELESGALLWKPLNKEEPQNEHFMKDFELTYNIAVLVEEKNGKVATWKKLPGVWDHLNNEKAFSKYIKDEVQNYLNGKVK